MSRFIKVTNNKQEVRVNIDNIKAYYYILHPNYSSYQQEAHGIENRIQELNKELSTADEKDKEHVLRLISDNTKLKEEYLSTPEFVVKIECKEDCGIWGKSFIIKESIEYLDKLLLKND